MAIALMYRRSHDPAAAYFVEWLICDPDLTPPDWEVDLSRCSGGSFEGALVKNTYRKQVWRLTGQVDATYGGYEGRWPD